jgi:ATP-dependent DNA helicase DinG
MMTFQDDIAEIFKPGGLLSDHLPGYEARPGQVEMAAAVAAALDGHAPSLAVEAETGIGKTLAYLIPAVLSRRKIIISTGTLNLQDQIINRDIPFLQTIISDLSALCVKGRRNYLCLYRWHQFLAARTLQGQLYDQGEEIGAITDWLLDTETGDRAELEWLGDHTPLWRMISADANQCLGSNCPEESRCYITQLRRKAGAARLLIVNHHLFFSDLALRRFGYGEVLPRYESVIFDEAHHLENVATSYFGMSFSHYQMVDLAADMEQLAKSKLAGKELEELVQTSTSLISRAELFASLFPKEKGRFPLAVPGRDFPWQEETDMLHTYLHGVADRLQTLAVKSEAWSGLEQRCRTMADTLQSIIAGAAEEEDGTVRWYERRERTVALTASPIDVAAHLQEHLYDRVQSAVFTSATLTVAGNFSYFLERLGLQDDTVTMTLPSPFDYAHRTLLYIPRHDAEERFPQPPDREFPKALQERIYEILLGSRGRALVLFTSLSLMNSTYRYLDGLLPFPVLVQGEAPRNVLLETFQSQTDSVLLAVASFWEGVNVPGESLSCVVIDKLPFEVPTDPVIMARINKIKAEGGNPFFDFQVPRAILSLRQGVGRLMRSTTDHGLLAIMDTRLYTKGYGRRFRASLPPSPVTRSMEDVHRFFSDKDNV